MLKRLILFTLLLVILFFSNMGYAEDPINSELEAASEAASKAERVDAYNVKMFSQDVVFSSPTNGNSFFFTIRPGIMVAEESFVRLHFSFSNTLLLDQSSVTIYLNGTPLYGEFLSTFDSRANIIVDAPLLLDAVKEGVNELRLQINNRSLEDLCAEYGNPTNWLVVHKDSVLHLRVKNDPVNRIKHYPYPFLNYLEQGSVHPSFFLPEKLDNHDIETLLKVASDWGVREPFKEFVPIVRKGIPAKVDSHQLFIGQLDHWQSSLGVGQPINSSSGMGAISYGESNWETYNRLLITGKDSVGIKRAADFISNPLLVSQVNTHELIIDQETVVDRGGRQSKESNNYFFSDLGYSDIVLRGPGVQRSSLFFQKPLGVNLQKGSFIELQFRNQQIEEYRLSSLTVEINGIPAQSVPLNLNTSKNGVVRIEIPRSVLGSSTWFIELIAFHDVIDEYCQSLPEEVFWTYVDKSSRIHLITSPAESNPSLDGFPKVYVSYNNNNASKAVLWLDENPSDVDLSIATQIAMRSSQQLQENLDWSVLLGEWNEEYMEGADYLFVISSNKDNHRLQPIAHMLYAYYKGNELQLREPMDIAIQQPSELMIIQATNYLPNPAAIIYAIVGVNDQIMSDQYHLLSDGESIRKMKGSVAVIDQQGEVFNIYDSNLREETIANVGLPAWIDSRASTRNILLASVTFVVFIALVTAGVAIIRKKRHTN